MSLCWFQGARIEQLIKSSIWLWAKFQTQKSFADTPSQGAAHGTFHSICSTSALQTTGVVTPPRLDSREATVSYVCLSDKMLKKKCFTSLEWIWFLAEGPQVHAGGRRGGCKPRRGWETQSGEPFRLTKLNTECWAQDVTGTTTLTYWRQPVLDGISVLDRILFLISLLRARSVVQATDSYMQEVTSLNSILGLALWRSM